MMMTISAGLGGLKSAIDAVKGIGTAVTDIKVAEAKSEVIGHLITAQQAMLDAQQTLLEDTDTIRALEAEIMKLKDWSAEAERYQPVDTGQGAIAYSLKSDMKTGEPEHWLCPNCFANRKKSYLQPEVLAVGRVHILRCHPCGMEIITHGLRQDQLARRR